MAGRCSSSSRNRCSSARSPPTLTTNCSRSLRFRLPHGEETCPLWYYSTWSATTPKTILVVTRLTSVDAEVRFGGRRTSTMDRRRIWAESVPSHSWRTFGSISTTRTLATGPTPMTIWEPSTSGKGSRDRANSTSRSAVRAGTIRFTAGLMPENRTADRLARFPHSTFY